MKTCEDCGTKLYSFGCPNCNEEDLINLDFAEEIMQISKLQSLEEEKC